MYKIAILGCENSHANQFLNLIVKDKVYTDIEVLGVYSDEVESANKLKDEYGVNVAKSYDEFVGKVDGIVITARHGDNHYKYAQPYMSSGIPMFIDKPITCSEEDAIKLKNDLSKNNIAVCGGSLIPLADRVVELKKMVESQEHGDICGGYVLAPINLSNSYGGFFFYTQHLAQVVCEVFGYYPESVRVYDKGSVLTCVIRYKDFDVTAQYIEGTGEYAAVVAFKWKFAGGPISMAGCFKREFEEFYDILKGGEMKISYDDFVAPVFLLNALNRSYVSGKEEKVNKL